MSSANSTRHPTTQQVAASSCPKEAPNPGHGARAIKSPVLESRTESRHSDTLTARAPTLPCPSRVEQQVNPVLQDLNQNREQIAVKNQQQHIMRQGKMIAKLEQKRDELRSELEAVQESSRELIEELSERNAEDRDSSQCSDSYLIERADRLRYLIDTFVTFSQDFERQMSPTIRSEKTRKAKYHAHLVSTTPARPTYLEILDTNVGLARILEAFVWSVLTNEVFGGFHWAGETVSSSIVEIRRFLHNAKPGSKHPSHDKQLAIRKWTLNTTRIIQDSLNDQSTEDVDLRTWKHNTINAFLEVTIGGPEDTMAAQLGEIIDVALDLDKKLSRQITPLEWRYNHELLQRTGYELHNDIMEVHDDDRVLARKRNQEPKPPRVQLVVAPALVKRRDLTTDGFGVEDVLLKSVVHYT